jgi:hypothetical protein
MATPTNHGAPWTLEQKEQLMTAFSEGQTLAQVAQLLQRTRTAVRIQSERTAKDLISEGQPSNTVVTRTGLSPERVATLTENVAFEKLGKGMTLDEVEHLTHLPHNVLEEILMEVENNDQEQLGNFAAGFIDDCLSIVFGRLKRVLNRYRNYCAQHNQNTEDLVVWNQWANDAQLPDYITSFVARVIEAVMTETPQT